MLGDCVYVQAARTAGVPVILDAGGLDTAVPSELLSYVDIFSPNESELGRLTGMPTESFEDIIRAVKKLHDMVCSISSLILHSLSDVLHHVLHSSRRLSNGI